MFKQAYAPAITSHQNRCVSHSASQRAKTEGVLPSSGLQEAEETQRGEERGASTEEPPEERSEEVRRVVSTSLSSFQAMFVLGDFFFFTLQLYVL